MTASDFAPLIPECCSEVLDAMYFTTVLSSATRDRLPEDVPDGPPCLNFGLGFTGDVSGRFGLQVEAATARTLAANFLGQEDTDTSAAEASEVIGELANMLCGSVMSRIKEKSKFVLSHPEPSPSFATSAGGDLLGGDLLGGDLIIDALDTDSGVITVWISVEGDSCPL